MATLLLTHPLILASHSPARHKLLLEVGLEHKVVPSTVDEEKIKATVHTLAIPAQARYLALQKGQSVSLEYPDHIVIAADQIGEFHGQPLFKPLTPEENVALLNRINGQSHQQHTVACIFRNGEELTHASESVTLTMRTLDISEIIAYVDHDKPWNCCGGYRFEGLGKHLFTSIHGSYDSVLGLPILPILNYLYTQQLLRLVANIDLQERKDPQGSQDPKGRKTSSKTAKTPNQAVVK